MTQPATQPPPQQQQQVQPPPPPDQTAQTAAAIVLLILLLWQANDRQSVTRALVTVFLLDQPTAQRLTRLVWRVTPSNPRPWRRTPASVAAHMQAMYLSNAADRVKTAVTAAGPGGVDRLRAWQQAMNREAVYAAQHRRAQARRGTAFAASKRLQRQHGRLLGWQATLDKHTSRACRLADGANYDAVRGPWPGTLHGGTCRCRPAPPRPGAPMVVDVWRRHGLSDHAEGAA